ncbi:MAG: hypothetical protein ORN56_08260 [Chitinophagales bacterium]|nr:hypothetical protein [Chitinophagales bacterium]
MKKYFFYFLAVLLNFQFHTGLACSGYKLTIGDKTVLGSNEDAWRTTPHIWFEPSNKQNKYGAAFTGSRFDGANGYAPQSGMNEVGLAFERLASYHPLQKSESNKKPITNQTAFLKNILHHCKNVEEAQAMIDQYDRSTFIEDVFLYVDKDGKHLVVEPYSTTIGNEASYLISNFCPSITSKEKALELERYRNGVLFLNKIKDSTEDFYRKLSDTMHVCRNKIGDGTLLTSIWNLRDKTINLYFYHNYDSVIHFNLKDELLKGEHIYRIDKLFPTNTEFEKLKSYYTAKNNNIIALGLILLALLLSSIAIYFLISSFHKNHSPLQRIILIGTALINFILTIYLYILFSNPNIYYFAAPYTTDNSFLNKLSYLPNTLLILIIPMIYFNFETNKPNQSNHSFTLNTLCYFILLAIFYYWHLYTFL